MVDAYCPTPRSYSMTPVNMCQSMAMPSGGRYQSLYSPDRRDLDRLEYRQSTFVFYPTSSGGMSTGDVAAAAGFYYIGHGSTVRCFCCQLTVTRFNEDDVPLDVHASRSPNCPFVRQNATSAAAAATSLPDHHPCTGEEDVVDGPDLDSGSSRSSDVETDGVMEVNCRRQKDSVATPVKATTPVVRPALPVDAVRLKAENERLRAEMTCRKCRESRVQTLFLPCRHLVTCEICADTMDDCIRCRHKILGTVRTYLL